ncbi:hypothetical protein GCM10022268_19540 [Sphingomonas cynarae]|uniref:Uncharacterized protein n=1 Tax=Sphingomonas cynarae TaxID=930197 RepID=A0ABP7DVM7_9SPHN
MTLCLPSGMRLVHEGRLLTLLGTDGWSLDIVDEDGEPLLLPIGPAGAKVRGDMDWLLGESHAQRLHNADDPYAILGGERGRFIGLDRSACVERDPKAAWRHGWAMAAIAEDVPRSRHAMEAFVGRKPAPAPGPRPKWRSLVRWVARLLEDPYRRIGNLVATSGRERGALQLPSRMDVVVHRRAVGFWTGERDPWKSDAAARVVAEWDELKASGATDIGDAPPSLECVRRRINALQTRTSYAARNGTFEAEKLYGAVGEPVGAEHVLERVTLDGVVFKHACLFSDDWDIPSARMKGVFAMDWKSSFVFDGPVFAGPFRPEVTERALLGLMTPPRLTPEQFEVNPDRALCFGLPSQLHPDNEKALLPPSMVPNLVNIISYLELPEGYHSDAKAKHERFHRFLHSTVRHLKGRIHGPGPIRDPRYDPLASADVSRAQFAFMIQAARNAWNERPKKFLGWRSPMQILLEGLTARRSRGMPPEEIERHLSRTVDVVLTNNGVEFDGLRYRWNERGVEKALDANLRRQPFADRLGATGRCSMTARVWDSDVDHIDVYDPEQRQYHRLHSTDPDYSAGLTRWEHHEYQKMLRAGKGGGTSVTDRLRLRNRLLRDQKAAMPKQAFRERAATTALLEHEEMRRAAGALGRSRVYDEMIRAIVPTEPSGALREDVPKAPSQTADARRAHRDDDIDVGDGVPPPDRSDATYPVSDRGAGIEDGDAEGRPASIWDDDYADDEED